jgi:DnaJ-class molecular chaperone
MSLDGEDVCDVCDGRGAVEVKNKYGEVVYLIDCPECGGKNDIRPGALARSRLGDRKL